MQQVQLVLVILGVFLSVIALITGFKLESAKRLAKIFLIAAGVFGLGVTSYVVVSEFLGERHDTVEVSGVGEHEMFRFYLKHERQYVDGTSYHFTSDDSWNEITSYLAQQFPQGKLTDSTKWELQSATTPVMLYASSTEKHEYVATRQVATVGAVNGEGGVEFAYPRGADSKIHFDDGVAAAGVSHAELVEYYKGLADVEILGSDIVIPTSEGTVILRESGQSPTFTRGN